MPLGTILLTLVWAIHRVGTFSRFAWGWRRPHSRKGAVSPPAGTPTRPGKVVAFHHYTLTAGGDRHSRVWGYNSLFPSMSAPNLKLSIGFYLEPALYSLIFSFPLYLLFPIPTATTVHSATTLLNWSLFLWAPSPSSPILTLRHPVSCSGPSAFSAPDPLPTSGDYSQASGFNFLISLNIPDWVQLSLYMHLEGSKACAFCKKIRVYNFSSENKLTDNVINSWELAALNTIHCSRPLKVTQYFTEYYSNTQ